MSFLTSVITKQAMNLLEAEMAKHVPEIQEELLQEALSAAHAMTDYIQAKIIAAKCTEE